MTADHKTANGAGPGGKKGAFKPLYLIALVPEPGLREQVSALKQEMKSRFRASHALKSPPHITLQMPFRRAETEESLLIEALGGFSAKEAPFRVRLSGFDCFAPRVLFVRVADHAPIIGLQARLKEELALLPGFPNTPAYMPFHPHMTIATRDLALPAFEKAWDEFRTREFEGSFMADQLCLLRHNGKRWDIHRAFPFKGTAGHSE